MYSGGIRNILTKPYIYCACTLLYALLWQALQKCDRFIEALDNLLIAEALAPVDPTIQTELQQLQEYINKHVTAQGVGCTFSW